jgi:hypothetical protein
MTAGQYYKISGTATFIWNKLIRQYNTINKV